MVDLPPVVGVLGLGLIGGSIAKRLLQEGVAVAGFDRSAQVRADARADGVDVVDAAGGLLARCGVVFVCVPIESLTAAFRAMVDGYEPEEGRSPIVTDVASVKLPAIAAALRADLSGTRLRFVPGHPMAGTETSGYGSSAASLFDGATWALCPEQEVDAAAYWELVPLVQRLGAGVIAVGAAAHDRAVAMVSHVPHIIASALLRTLPTAASGRVAGLLHAGSFADMTRVGGADPELWANISLANAANIHDALDAVQTQIALLRSAVRADDPAAVRTWFGEGARSRAALTALREDGIQWHKAQTPSERAALWRRLREPSTDGTRLRCDADGLHWSAEHE